MLQFLGVDADVFAQQMTIVAANLYNNITAGECEAWPSLSKNCSMPEQTPHINAMIRHHNEIHLWALGTITTPIDHESQLRALNHLIAIADACRVLNNFSTLASIVSAVTDEQAQRASQSLAAPTRLKLMQLDALIGPAKGFIAYRQAVRLAVPPCVPCLGLSTIPFHWPQPAHLFCNIAFAITDLKFIEEGTPSLRADGTRNELKPTKTAMVIAETQRYQSEPYRLLSRPDIQRLISTSLEAFTTS